MTITEGNQLASPATQPLSATDREKAVKQREENQKKFVYATKEVSPTTPKGQANLPTFDSTKELPPTVLQTPKWQFNFKTSFIGLEALTYPCLKARGFLIRRDSNEFTLSKHLDRMPYGCKSSN